MPPISAEGAALLQRQVDHEYTNFALYKAIAVRFEVLGYSKLKEYFQKQADEEMQHGDRTISFLADRDFDVTFQISPDAVPDWIGSFTGFEGASKVAEIFVHREESTTLMLEEIYNHPATDLLTKTCHLQYFISEQVEEEASARQFRDRLEEFRRMGPAGLCHFSTMLHKLL